MRYFLLEQDKGYTDIPVPLGWYEILAPGKAMESLKKLPRRTIFKIKTGEYTNWNYDLKKAVLDGSKLKDKAVFTVKGPQKLNIAVRLDAAESLLRRGVKGLMFKEMEVKT